MSKRNDGGGAFPCETKEYFLDVSRTSKKQGMSLRDYFAAKAMQALLTSGDYSWSDAASDSYIMADAMLAEREN